MRDIESKVAQQGEHTTSLNSTRQGERQGDPGPRREDGRERGPDGQDGGAPPRPRQGRGEVAPRAAAGEAAEGLNGPGGGAARPSFGRHGPRASSRRTALSSSS
eukprot:911874-Alexandrium_andersonii.AAC.1